MTSSAIPLPADLVDRTWLVVPVWNEASVVGDVIREARAVFTHVVCVDDGSSDASVEVARAAGATVVRHPVNLGQGAALQTGFAYTLTDPQMEFVVTFDADDSTRSPTSSPCCGGASTTVWTSSSDHGSSTSVPDRAGCADSCCGWPWPTPI